MIIPETIHIGNSPKFKFLCEVNQISILLFTPIPKIAKFMQFICMCSVNTRGTSAQKATEASISTVLSASQAIFLYLCKWEVHIHATNVKK